jgi:uncharacterized protein (DUF302 family)
MLRALALAIATLALLAPTAEAQNNIAAKASNFTVAETADRLVKAVEAKGIKIAARIDHAASAKAAGLELLPTVVVMFGNPKLGTPVMQADPRIGLDLPMRMLVWQDKAGKVWVGYTPPSTLQARYAIEGVEPVAALESMAGALEGFANAATGTQ